MQTFKKTFRTILIFVLLFTILSIAIFEVFFQSELHSYQDIRERDAFAGTLDTLITGASYTKRALIPEQMDAELGTSTYNLSGSDMTMQGRYEMLAQEIGRNPVKTVYLELSMHTMNLVPGVDTLEGDLYVIPRLPTPAERIRYALSAFSVRNYGWLYRQLLERGMKDLVSFFEGKYTTVNKYQLRGYVPFKKNEDYLEVVRTPEEGYHQATLSEEKYPVHVKYLNKIIETCKEHNAELIFVAMPISESEIAYISNMQEIHDYYQSVADEHGITFIDFNLWKNKRKLIPDTKYHNYTHLNNKAAKVFTKNFCIVMKRHFAKKDINKYFYPDYATLEHERGYGPAATQP